MEHLTSEHDDRVKKALEPHKTSLSQSTGASVNFHEKLAVLTAGSLALAVSGAGILYQKPLTNAVAMRWLLYSLAFSSICLWASLLASLLHNFVEAVALHLTTKFSFWKAGLRAIELVVDADKEKEFGEEEMKRVRDIAGEQALSEMQRTYKLREWEMPLSAVAVSLFALGYLSVVAYVVVLAIVH